MKDIHILHILCKYLLRGRVTLGERAFGQILTLSDHPSFFFHFFSLHFSNLRVVAIYVPCILTNKLFDLTIALLRDIPADVLSHFCYNSLLEICHKIHG